MSIVHTYNFDQNEYTSYKNEKSPQTLIIVIKKQIFGDSFYNANIAGGGEKP